jgi:hypothetical protein
MHSIRHIVGKPLNASFAESIGALFRLKPQDLAEQMADLANRGDPLAEHWLERLTEFGPASKDLLSEIVETTGPYSVSTKMWPVVNGNRIAWATDYDLAGEFLRKNLVRDDGRAQKARYALAMARLLEAGEGKRLRRCPLSDTPHRRPYCRRFFVSTRSRWCCDDCGNYARVNAHNDESTADVDAWLLKQERLMRKQR